MGVNMTVKIFLKSGRTIYLEDVFKIEYVETVANEGKVTCLFIQGKYYSHEEHEDIVEIKIKFKYRR